METATRPCQASTMMEKERIHRAATSCIRRRRKRQGKRRGCFSAGSTVIAIIFLVPCFCDTQQLTLSLAVAAASSAKGNETHSDNVVVQDSLVDSLLEAPPFHNSTSSSMPLVKKKSYQHHRTTQEEMKLQAQQKRIPTKEESLNPQDQEEYQQYMEWCLKVLGIQTSLEIHTFMYYDYMSATMTHPADSDFNNDDDDDFETELISNATQEKQWQDPPMIPVRGLRATRNISQGEIIISIPFQALLTVSNTIDQDPVLSRVMGPHARKDYGWTLEQDTGETTDHLNNNHDATNVDFFELPLLAMALLHHYKLGTSSPMYPYIHLLRKSPLDAMPFLWGKKKRHEQYGQNPTSAVSKGIQTVARSIRLEMKDMYHTVVDTLLLHHPELFGRRNANTPSSSPDLEYDVLDEEEWAFSFENFQWAFAMVNSRHWLLPIVDLDPPSQEPPPQPAAPNMMQPQRSLDGVPPAEMPTDAWVVGQTEQEDDGAPTSPQQPREPKSSNNTKPKATSYHSFLAPVADLLNFGPPCTRGRYNPETHTFDIIASCAFIPGQEVTFWYSDECEDIVMGNYGFTHPMVPKCPTAEDYKISRDKWRQRATNLQTALEDAYEDMDAMDTELQHVQRILANCDCCDTDMPRPPQSQQEQQPQAATPKEQILAKPSYNQQERQPQGTVEDRNPQDPAPSQIRGGGGNRMSRSTTNGGSNVDTRPRSSHGSRSSSRRKTTPTDDDVERHGVRRMWAGRSGL